MLLVNYKKKNLPLPALVKLVWKVKAVSGVLGGGGSRWWRPRRDTSVPAPPVPATEARLKDLWGWAYGRKKKSQAALVFAKLMLFSAGGRWKVVLVVVWIMTVRWVSIPHLTSPPPVAGGGWKASNHLWSGTRLFWDTRPCWLLIPLPWRQCGEGGHCSELLGWSTRFHPYWINVDPKTMVQSTCFCLQRIRFPIDRVDSM